LKEGGKLTCSKVVLIKDVKHWEEEVFIGLFVGSCIRQAKEYMLVEDNGVLVCIQSTKILF